MDMQKRYIILNEKKKIIKSICPEITTKSGIYLFCRKNEENEFCYYVGQAKNLLQRTAQHLMDKKQHIDKSLYVHNLYRKNNPFGWNLRVLIECKESDLDYWEKAYINFYKNKGKLYNVNGGGQFDKAEDIGERFEVKLKSYRNGKAIAYDKAREYVKNMFDKYLDYTIKGKTNKIKERKIKEFEEFLGGTENV